jgi:AraC-like DNA-binding protein
VLHEIVAAGRFPHADRDFERWYKGATHCFHLYEYACDMRWDGEQEHVDPGDLSFSPAQHETRYHLPRPGRHWCIHFIPQPVGSLALELPLLIRLGHRSEFVAQRMAHIARLHARGRVTGDDGALARVAASAALQELLLWLALESRAAGPRTRADAAAELAATLVASRLAEGLSVPDLAREVGVSQNHLAARFRSRFGVTIPRYLLTRRVERARQLLATTDLPVREIAAAVGMPDAQHFNKQFRRLVGHAPSAERPAVSTPMR